MILRHRGAYWVSELCEMMRLIPLVAIVVMLIVVVVVSAWMVYSDRKIKPQRYHPYVPKPLDSDAPRK